jgi:hypothetical protein
MILANDQRNLKARINQESKKKNKKKCTWGRAKMELAPDKKQDEGLLTSYS